MGRAAELKAAISRSKIRVDYARRSLERFASVMSNTRQAERDRQALAQKLRRAERDIERLRESLKLELARSGAPDSWT